MVPVREPSRSVSMPFERRFPPSGRRTIVIVLTDVLAALIGLALLVYLAFALAKPESF